MDNHEIHAGMAECIAAQGGTDAPVDCLSGLGRIMRLKQGEAARLESREEHLFFVASGATKLVAQLSDGTEQIVGFNFASEFATLPAHAQYPFSLRALVPSEVLMFRTEDAIAAAHAQPQVLTILLERAFRSLHRCMGQAVLLGRHGANARVAGFIVSLSQRIGNTDGEGRGLINLPMSRRDIADYLGLTVETISRQVSAMRKEGLIETPSRSQVRLLRPDKLAILAGQFAIAA